MSKLHKRSAVSAPVSLGSPGSTFRVAAAQRVLAADLPDLIYSGGRVRRPSSAPASVASARSALVSEVPVRRDVSRPAGLSLARSDLSEPRLGATCKARPTDNSKSGGGSRGFIPWCRKS